MPTFLVEDCRFQLTLAEYSRYFALRRIIKYQLGNLSAPFGSLVAWWLKGAHFIFLRRNLFEPGNIRKKNKTDFN